jgi:hypothetical protein
MYVEDDDLASLLLKDPAMETSLQAAIGDSGTMVARDSRTIKSLSRKWEFAEYWTTGDKGVIRTAFPLDRDSCRFGFRNVLHGNSSRNRLLSRCGAIANAVGLLPRVARQRIYIARRRSESIDVRMPHYLRKIVDRAGERGTRVAMSARGRFDSNKTLLYIFDGAAQPEVIVKISRDAKFNFRLENEFSALKFLRSSGYLNPNTLAKPLLLDKCGDLAVTTQRIVDGTPFKSVSLRTAGCAWMHRAVFWIEELGEMSAHAFPGAVSTVFSELVSRCDDYFTFTEAERHALKEHIAALTECNALMPAVYQHGDTGVWNLAAQRDGTLAVFDWENGDPEGIPLWDLFYFLASYGRLCRAESKSYCGIESFAVPNSFLRETAQRAISSYTKAVGVPETAINSLFYLFLAHRALREAWYVPKAQRQQGEYIRSLRFALHNRLSLT